MAQLTNEEHLSTAEARNNFSDVINRAAYGKERVVLTRRGKDIVGVVPMEDILLLEKLEDQLDIQLADAAKKAIAAGETTLSLEDVAKAWGLD